MKTILAVLALATLGGCVVAPPAPTYYGGRAAPVDPYQWHTVAVEPAGASRVQYSSEPVYAPQPVYAAPVYAPVYAAPAPSYYYPPVTIGLDFVFGNWCCGHRWGGRGAYRHR
ncbi:hypothetical protein [Rugamonas apoptosis]|uniref:PXPV repeat-containing protein n=1 Tax=Rugamonas apoptosis TaxID=2758570 RepID=A0A7W2FDE9_9BURK|nr:hypothetical protein [Rugamonas apoptosis]MBA5689577.1 hypothetical protein [Rugamonas apoptosis]